MTTSQNSINQTGLTAPLQGQQSNESLISNTISMETPSLEVLSQTDGHLVSVKRLAEENLVAQVEGISGPVKESSRKIISKFLDRTSRGYVGSMPMICKRSCPFLSACPLKEAGEPLPLGARCPVEATIMQMWVSKHLAALNIKDINSPENSFDMDLLYELAGQELIRWRCGVHISDSPALVAREQVGETLSGIPMFEDVMNPVLEIMERAGRNISRIREALLATRKAQIEAGQIAHDYSQKTAMIKAKAEEMVRKRMADSGIKDAEFNVRK